MKKIRFAIFVAGISAMLMVPASAYVEPADLARGIQVAAGLLGPVAIIVVVAVVLIFLLKKKK